MGRRSLKTAVGWTCTVVVALQVVFGILGAVAVKMTDVPANFRDLAGPSPWFSLGLSTGTGVFVNDRGDVLTSDHVIAGCRRITIAGNGFSAVRARVLAKLDDSFRDLAVLHIDRTPNSWLSFEEQPLPNEKPSLSLTVPSPIMLLGFPALMNGVVPRQETVSSITPWRPAGDPSSKHLQLNVVAVVHPGNSGSPVIDGHGRIVGLITTGTFADRQSRVTDLTAESGNAVYGRYISDWLHDVGIPVTVNAPDLPAASLHAGSSAVVRVFCFGQRDTRDISVSGTRGSM